MKNAITSSGLAVSVKVSDSDDCFLVANKKLNRAALVGISFDYLKAFSINIKKWYWAESEGFTIDEMIENFGREIFEEMDIDEVVEYILEK